jgi:biotin synthase
MIEPDFIPTRAMLGLRGTAQAELHERAASAAQTQFGKSIFVRGVVEASNFCRENCHYCGMRRDNRALDRFRARHDELAEMLIHHRPPAITDINIQTGEDPVAVREVVLPLIKTLRRETPLGISVCLGTLTTDSYAELQEAGASIYILKFELGSAARYGQLEAPGNFKERIEHIHHLANAGWRVSSGFISGLPGQSEEELLENLFLARSLPLAGCSVSPFIPGDETPLSATATADLDVTLNCMAALRLMRPDWVIPAVSALNLTGENGGYRRGLRTGANLATINLTPSDVRGDYLLYKRDRFIMTEEKILSAISAEGMTVSRQSLAGFYRGEKINGATAALETEPAVA